jgi:hypothetical protein
MLTFSQFIEQQDQNNPLVESKRIFYFDFLTWLDYFSESFINNLNENLLEADRNTAFHNQTREERMNQKDEIETKIRRNLIRLGMNVKKTSRNEERAIVKDKKQKVDVLVNGRNAQLKKKKGKAFGSLILDLEVVVWHDKDINVKAHLNQLNEPDCRGKDMHPHADLYFVEDSDGLIIYQISAMKLQAKVKEALDDLNVDPSFRGLMDYQTFDDKDRRIDDKSKMFLASNKVLLSPFTESDSVKPNDKWKWKANRRFKIMAKVPIDDIIEKTYNLPSEIHDDEHDEGWSPDVEPVKAKIAPVKVNPAESLIDSAKKQLDDYLEEKIHQIEVPIASTKLDKNQEVVKALIDWAKTVPLKHFEEKKHPNPKIVTKIIFTL